MENTKSIINSDKFTAVFIDTNYFVSDKFNFDPTFFTTLKEYIYKDGLKFITTTITKNEMVKHLKKQLEEDQAEIKRALSMLNKTLKVKSISELYSRNGAIYPTIPILENVNFKDIDSLSKQIIDDFLEEMNAKVIDVKSVCPEKIFDLYFAKEPPFSNEKKDEFPDAFVLSALLQQKEDILFLSADNDFYHFIEKNDPEGMGIVKNRTDVIKIIEIQSIYSVDKDPNRLATKLIEFKEPIQNNTNLRKQLIEKTYELLYDDSYEQFTLQNEELFYINAYDIDYHIDESSIEILDNIEFLSMDEESVLTIKISNITISYTGEVAISASIIDYWDRDYIPLSSNCFTVESSITVTATFKIKFDSEFKKSRIENYEYLPDEVEDMPIYDLLVDCIDAEVPEIDLLREPWLSPRL